ncbi:MAG: Glutamyl-tRNA(Gln) amidotransferase subunit E [Methanomethylovorans sp. PtaU1.Bin073]|nr:MAG: Glutamyl-tRNA(Gln) amidotransferase subunit E [Methanomethylovorans sp. PtaU1.Bin073]
MLPELKRDGVDIDKLCDDHFRQVFSLVEQGAFSREGIDSVLRILAQKPQISAEKAAAEAGLSGSDTAEIEKFIDVMISERQEFVKQKGPAAVGPLMGVVMAEFRGKVDGKILSELLKQKINKFLSI